MITIGEGVDDICEQAELAYSRLRSLGYILEIRSDPLISDNGVCVFYQFGDPCQRIAWKQWDQPQTLAIERYKGKTLEWQEQEIIPLADFAFGDLPPAFVGSISDTIRNVALKIQNEAKKAGREYYFQAPVNAEAREQILHRIMKGRRQRLRIIPRGADDAILIFEGLPFAKEPQWQHIHRTTASIFLEPDYRHDVDVASIPSVTPVAGDPDCPTTFFGRGKMLLQRLIN